MKFGPLWHGFAHRLKSDYRLAIVSILGLAAVAGIAPFAVYRFWRGEIGAGILDTVIVLAFLVFVIFSWGEGRSQIGGVILSVIACLAAIVSPLLLGPTATYWIFPALVTAYFLISAKYGLIVNILSIASLIILAQFSDVFVSAGHFWAFLASLLLLSFAIYIVAKQVERQHQTLQLQAQVDMLTGLGNRRMFESEMANALSLHRRTGVNYGLALLDLDHFKRINDTLGHSEGDRVLMEIGRLLKKRIRISDSAFRYGGEEFVVVAPAVDEQGLADLCEQLRVLIQEQLSTQLGPVAASFGGSLCRSGDTMQSWFERADSMLYRAKQAGRNRVMIDQHASLHTVEQKREH